MERAGVMDTTDNGVRYAIHKIGTPQFRNVNGKLTPSGKWWHGTGWGDNTNALLIERLNGSLLPEGGEWVAVFLNVSVNGEVG